MGKKKAGDIMVKVGRAGSKAEDYSLNGDRTVMAAIKAAGFSKKESEIVNVNGEEVDDMYTDLEEGDRVILVKNIEGGGK